MQRHKVIRYPAWLVIFVLVSGPASPTRAEVYYEEVPVLDVTPIIERRRLPVQERVCIDRKPDQRPAAAASTDIRAGRPRLSLTEAVREDRNLWREPVAAPPRCRMIERYERLEEVVGYRVEYVYGSELFVARMDHDPGERVRVRVELRTTDRTGARAPRRLTSSGHSRYR